MKIIFKERVKRWYKIKKILVFLFVFLSAVLFLAMRWMSCNFNATCLSTARVLCLLFLLRNAKNRSVFYCDGVAQQWHLVTSARSLSLGFHCFAARGATASATAAPLGPPGHLSRAAPLQISEQSLQSGVALVRLGVAHRNCYYLATGWPQRYAMIVFLCNQR